MVFSLRAFTGVKTAIGGPAGEHSMRIDYSILISNVVIFLSDELWMDERRRAAFVSVYFIITLIFEVKRIIEKNIRAKRIPILKKLLYFSIFVTMYKFLINCKRKYVKRVGIQTVLILSI